MNWYDTNTNSVYTQHGLHVRGLRLDVDTLLSIGIYPMTYPRQPHDERLYAPEPMGKPHPDEAGTTYVQDFMLVPLSLEAAQHNLKTAVTDKRWQVETDGIALPDGTKIATGIDDQNRISSALQGMADAAIAEVDFKSESGWVKLTREQLTGIAALIAAHVQACFSRERVLHDAIDAAESVTALEAIDVNIGWPNSACETPQNDEPQA